MSKQMRGKAIRRSPGFRGTCPVCGRRRVKIIWTKVLDDGKKSNCCKVCAHTDKTK